MPGTVETERSDFTQMQFADRREARKSHANANSAERFYRDDLLPAVDAEVDGAGISGLDHFVDAGRRAMWLSILVAANEVSGLDFAVERGNESENRPGAVRDRG